MLNSGGNTILLPTFGGLSGEVTPVLLLIHICFKRLAIEQVDGGGIIYGLGREGGRYRCVGDGGRHHMSYGRDKAL